MVNSDGQSVRRIGAEAKLYPAARVLRVDAADFDAPRASSHVDFSPIQVDKKLVSVSNGGRDGACESDFSGHGQQLCKFSTSRKHGISLKPNARAHLRTPASLPADIDALPVKCLDQLADTEGLAGESSPWQYSCKRLSWT